MNLLARTSLEQKSNGQHDPQSRPPSAQAEGWKACQQIQAARTTAAPRLSLQPDQQTAFRVGCLPQLVVSIAAVRSLTTAIRTGRLPLHDISAGDVHIHYYLPGIALLTAAGGIGVRGSDKTSVHCLLGATYGTGCALITDELPLLLNLRDVYWTPEGRWALDVAFGIIASVGAYFSGIPLWHGLSEEITGKPAQPGPAPSPDSQTGAGNQEPP